MRLGPVLFRQNQNQFDLPCQQVEQQSSAGMTACGKRSEQFKGGVV